MRMAELTACWISGSLPLKVGHAVPYQLHGNGQNQESENTVDRAHGAWSKTFDEGAAEQEKEINRQAEGKNTDHHAQVGKKVIGIGAEPHHYADGTWAR